MDLNKIENTLVEFVSTELLDRESSVNSNEHFENLGLGSIEVMEIIFFIEKEFKVKLDAEIFRGESLKNIKNLSEFLFNFLKVPTN